MLRIDGRFTGRVRSEKGSLIVSAGGVVEANIEVASAKINGTVNGDIIATGRVEFGRSARVNGNIQTPALVIEDGAVFEGSCRMQTQPKPEPARAPKAEAPRPAAPPPPRHSPSRPRQTRAADARARQQRRRARRRRRQHRHEFPRADRLTRGRARRRPNTPPRPTAEARSKQ